MNTPPTLPDNLSELVRTASLGEAREQVERELRRKPDINKHFLRLELFCLLEETERAVKQAETCVRFDPAVLPTIAPTLGLLHAEQVRNAVFAGQARAELPPNAPEWPNLLMDALHAQARNDVALADTLREKALEAVPETSGLAVTDAAESPFDWITDSDTRLGPVMEVIMEDSYFWVPFTMIQNLELAVPSKLRDFAWLPVTFVVNDLRRHGFIPGRYPGSGAAGDALALGRETRWTDEGQTGVFGLGQKVWITDAGDLPLYDLRGLRKLVHSGTPEISEASESSKTLGASA